MLRVLVIDDNADMRALIGVILEGAGYSVELEADGEAGLRSHRARPFDIVITDIFMPNQDGIETIARLLNEYPALKLVAISGGGSHMKGDGYLYTARELGAQAVLTKPFDREQLLQVVRSLHKTEQR